MNQSTLAAVLNTTNHTIETIEFGIDRTTTIGFEKPVSTSKNNLEIITYFTHEILKNGYLAGGLVAPSYAYNYKFIEKYLKEVEIVFGKIAICLKNNKFPLEGKIKHSTFKRLTG